MSTNKKYQRDLLEHFQFLSDKISEEVNNINRSAQSAIGYFSIEELGDSEYFRIHRNIFDERDRRIAKLNDTTDVLIDAIRALVREQYADNEPYKRFWNA